jgi:hypothetical protein
MCPPVKAQPRPSAPPRWCRSRARAIRTIDARSTESATSLSKAEIDRIPVTRNVTAVTLLAPGAVVGDSRIGQTTARAGNVPSLGGASPAENAYYVNGFNVTNILNGVAFSQIPFEAIADLSVKTGGYGAEYGRSLGGAVIVTSKRGTNEWHGGASVSYAPKLAARLFRLSERNPTTLEWELKDRPGGVDDLTYNIFGGGPIIQDKLFFFGLVQGSKYTSETYRQDDADQADQQHAAVPAQARLERDRPQHLRTDRLQRQVQGQDRHLDLDHEYKEPKGSFIGPSTATTGGNNVVGKWTSLITDDLSVSALYGVGKYSRSESAAGSDCDYAVDQRVAPTIRIPGSCWVVANIPEPTNGDKRTAFRLDAEWALGIHKLKAGLDRETIKVSDGSQRSGGIEHRLFRRNPGQRLTPDYVVPGAAGGPSVDYIRTREFRNGGKFDTINSAWFVEDAIDVTRNLVVSLGVRNESFNNKNASGVDFINVKNTWAPRVGVAWDLTGDAKNKLYANAGRYYIPVMANTNVRLSGAETDIQTWYLYSGNNTNGIPNPNGGAVSTNVVSNGVAPNPTERGRPQHQAAVPGRVHRRHGQGADRPLDGGREGHLPQAQERHGRHLQR